MRYLPDDNLSYPVLVKNSNDISIGSGCLFRHHYDLYFVTAKHVLFDIENSNLMSDNIKIYSYSRDLKVEDPIIVLLNLKQAIPSAHNSEDVAVVKIGEIEKKEGLLGELKLINGCTVIQWPENASFVNATSESIKAYNDVLISNEVYAFGYPISLGYRNNKMQIEGKKQIDYDKPLLRKGIIAGKNKENKTIIIDCPIYQGNSGGPVFEVEELNVEEMKSRSLQGISARETKLIGLVIEFIPFTEITESFHFRYRNTTLENSGYGVVVPADRIMDILEQISNKTETDSNIDSTPVGDRKEHSSSKQDK